MNVLVTGAFGNIGISALEELLEQGHRVRCFDLNTKANRKAARRFGKQIEIVWGDLRHPDDVARAVLDQDVAIHLAFIIPKMSATGIESESNPDLARQVNIGGTRNLIKAMKALPSPARILFTSSLHVYGRTQNQAPPRTVCDPIHPIEYYSHHKVACERMVRASGLQWTILRLAATLPLAIQLDPGMFDVPLNNRMEFVHTRDVGLAIANAVGSDEVWGRTLLVGGGPAGCQLIYREIVEGILEAMGVGMLPSDLFGTTPFCTDWLDTRESQQILRFQRHDFEDYLDDMVRLLGWRRGLIRLFRPLVRAWLARKSPHFGVARRGARGRRAPDAVAS